MPEVGLNTETFLSDRGKGQTGLMNGVKKNTKPNPDQVATFTAPLVPRPAWPSYPVLMEKNMLSALPNVTWEGEAEIYVPTRTWIQLTSFFCGICISVSSRNNDRSVRML